MKLDDLKMIARDMAAMILIMLLIMGAAILIMTITSDARQTYNQGQSTMIDNHKADIKAHWNKD